MSRFRPRMRAVAALGLVALLLAGAAGCGDPEAEYCTALKGDQETFAEMQADTTGITLLQHRTMLHALADKAPDDLTDEWQTFLSALDSFAATLAHAGVKPGDFVDGEPPTGLDAATRTQIAQAADVLSSDSVVEAASGIEQQAKDVCKLQLGL